MSTGYPKIAEFLSVHIAKKLEPYFSITEKKLYAQWVLCFLLQKHFYSVRGKPLAYCVFLLQKDFCIFQKHTDAFLKKLWYAKFLYVPKKQFPIIAQIQTNFYVGKPYFDCLNGSNQLNDYEYQGIIVTLKNLISEDWDC